MAITKERIRELIKQHDEHPDPKLGGLNYYSTLSKMWMEHAGCKWFSELSCLHPKPGELVWDLLPEKERDRIMAEVKTLVIEVMREDGDL